MMNIDIYTDGASKGNPGQAGYGYIILINDTKYYYSFGVDYATNNQMELQAVIKALYYTYKQIINYKSISDSDIVINVYSDSRYVCDAFNKNWLSKWIKEDFTKIKNPDLWRKLHLLLSSVGLVNRKINFIWIRGHSGNEYNEEADSLAQMACGHEGIVMQGFVKI